MRICNVEFKNTVNSSSVSMELYSRYACILGKYSGEGKTKFHQYIIDGMATGEVEVSCTIGDEKLEFTTADSGSLSALLDSPKKLVIFIDESSMLMSPLLKRCHESHHLFICISRSNPMEIKGYYAMCGIYEIFEDEKENFYINRAESLPLLQRVDRKFDKIVTEALEGKSENALLSVYLDNLVSASGKDRIQNKLRLVKDENVLVFVDLGNIGSCYRLLMRRSQGKNIFFYGYLCFEQILAESDLVKELNKFYSGDNLDSFSLKRYYEDMLFCLTKGTYLSYDHANPVLKKPYLDKSNFDKVFSGRVSRLLKEYINKYGNR